MTGRFDEREKALGSLSDYLVTLHAKLEYALEWSAYDCKATAKDVSEVVKMLEKAKASDDVIRELKHTVDLLNKLAVTKEGVERLGAPGCGQ